MGVALPSDARARDASRRLALARARTDDFFALLAPATLYERAIAERHRPVFYLGHLEAFDWNLLARGVLGLPAAHPTFDRLFAFGIDPLDGIPQDVSADWPGRPEIDAYRARIRESLDARLEEAARADPVAVEMAIEHRLMHAETLAYMLHCLPLGSLVPPPEEQRPRPVGARRRPPGPGFVEVPAGIATLGRRRAAPGYGWDNEHEEHGVHVPAFRVSVDNVTNGDFLAFVRAGGYDERSLWRKEDWAWRQASGRAFPVRFLRRGDGWWQRRSFAEVPLVEDEPVQVSFAEASAYAAWKGMRLLTEAEYHRAAFGTPEGEERPYPWGTEAPRALVHGNFGFARRDPVPVGSFEAGRSAFGVADLAGNGWEWTETVFQPFEGFEPHPLYSGYSRDFFDGRHFVLKGGSPRTDASLLRRSFRNWFQPHYPHVFASFRLAQSI